MRESDPGDMFVDPWQYPQGRARWPEVPTADQKYTKLPNRKKIVRIRETIYEDPGNPFADERHGASSLTLPTDTKPLPPIPAMMKETSRARDPFDINPFEDGAFSKVPATRKNSVKDIWASTFRRGSVSPRRHRRSKSIAVPLQESKEEFGEYIAPRKLWRKGSLPTSHLSQPLPPCHDPWRDTKFDQFYDDLIDDYNTEGSHQM